MNAASYVHIYMCMCISIHIYVYTHIIVIILKEGHLFEREWKGSLIVGEKGESGMI